MADESRVTYERISPFSSSAWSTRKTKLANLDGALVSAFGQLRVATPFTLFDSKQLYDNQPLYWDDQETSGAGTSSTYDSDAVTSTLAVTATTAGTRVRQTLQRFNYQPGKSQFVALTGVIGSGESGITSCIGMYDDEDGFFFEVKDGVMGVVLRSSVTGSAVDTRIEQTDWNIDNLLGADAGSASEVVADWDKTHIFVVDFQWLGVGRVRFGLDIDGILIYVHEFLHANQLDVPYSSNPNLPLRYEIQNDGTGGAADLDHICSTVVSEGGRENIGQIQHVSTITNPTAASGFINANTTIVSYATVGLRLKSTCLSASVEFLSASIIAITNDDFEWLLMLNPTFAAALTWADQPNSVVQVGVGDTTGNPSTTSVSVRGTVVGGGFGHAGVSAGSETVKLDSTLRLGSKIDGTPDEIVLVVRPLTTNADVHGAITWRELS